MGYNVHRQPNMSQQGNVTLLVIMHTNKGPKEQTKKWCKKWWRVMHSLVKGLVKQNKGHRDSQPVDYFLTLLTW